MHQPILFSLTLIVVLGAAAQWLAWATRLPSILLLLLAGFLAGPLTGWIEPDQIFGKLLLPFVSLSVALILFEGGLSLRIREIKGVRAVVFALVTVGVVVTWVVAGAAAYYLLGFDVKMSALLGAILSVTGPTVVQPLLRHIRPIGLAGSILKWEGIVVDPVGAMLSVIVFEIAFGDQLGKAAHHLITVLWRTVLSGGIGLAAAGVIVVTFKRYWVPDHLRNAVAMMLVVISFYASNRLQAESGLLAVSVMGIALGNQRWVDMRHVLEFKENLRVFLLSAIFILLSARIPMADLARTSLREIAFVVILIVIVRPASVFVSTLGSRLTWAERGLIACMAPRGIVAAAVASVFAFSLERYGVAEGRLLVPIVFGTIVGTVLFYGLIGPIIARRLKLADSNPQGVLLVGAGLFSREVARVLQSLGFRVLAADTNRYEIRSAQMEGIPVYHGNVLSEEVGYELDLAGIGKMMAITPNDEVNQLAVETYSRVFGSANTFRLAPKPAVHPSTQRSESTPPRALFSAEATFGHLSDLCKRGAKAKATKLSSEFNYEAFRAEHGSAFIPLFVLNQAGQILVVRAGAQINPVAGDTIVTLNWSEAKNGG